LVLSKRVIVDIIRHQIKFDFKTSFLTDPNWPLSWKYETSQKENDLFYILCPT